jgi:hypothetical protein
MRTNKADRLRERYPAGTRVELLGMDDPMAIEVGTRGTVLDADDAGQLIMKWDNGRGLSLIPGVDQFRVLSQEEIQAETQATDNHMKME